MNLGMEGRVALVTAASKGLGRASAVALAEEGCRVVICARGEEALADAAQEIGNAGSGDVLAVVDDVTEADAPARLVATTVEHFGSVDIVVGNAGGPPAGRALEVSDDALSAAFNANMVTSVRLAQAAVPHMRERRWGRICFVTSYSVKQPIPTLALSNVARTGLWAWAKTAAADLIGDGITVNLAAPGLHDTDRVRALRGGAGAAEGELIGDPRDFGRVVAFLCSEPARFVSGVALQVDGAATLGLL